jgi:signal peptide peptidase SppA
MSDRSYRHIVKFATSTPWMMIPETLELVCEVLTARISGDRWSDAESAARIRAARGTKPILAVSDTMMASAAYYLGSQADEVYVTPSGLIGSIGVYATHYDQSGLNEKTGVKPTLVSAGKYKTELNANEPPTEAGIAHLQSIVDDVYQQFTLDVSKGRNVSVADVRGGFGEGRVLTAKMGVREGLADGIKTREETIARAGELALAAGGRSRGASVAFAAELDRAAAEADDGEPPNPDDVNPDPALDQEGDNENEPEAIGSAEAASIADQLDGALCATEELVAQGRPLTAAKRERLEAIRDRVDDLLVAEPPMAAVGSETTVDELEAMWTEHVLTIREEQ